MTQTAILGAGLAGLALARLLRDRGQPAIVFDKGRGPGGRTSTRRGDGASFDHGAPFFEFRDPAVLTFVDHHAPGVLAPWKGRFATFRQGRLELIEPATPRLVGVPGMNALARSLAVPFDVRSGVRIESLRRSPHGWTLIDPDGVPHGPFHRVVLTAPPTQTAALLDGHSPIADRLAAVRMLPIFALMLNPPPGVELPADGITFDDHPALRWAANEHRKPGRSPREAIVLHASPEFTRAYLDADRAEVGRLLQAAPADLFGLDLGPPPPAESVHRWLYALADEPLEAPCLIDPDAGLLACGDWCLGRSAEESFRSALACDGALAAL